jgi:hypothetical protein
LIQVVRFKYSPETGWNFVSLPTLFLLNRDMEPKVNLVRQLGLAAVLLPLLYASPVAAQDVVNGNSSRLTNSLGSIYGPSSQSLAREPGRSGALFPEARRGISVAERPMIREDGTRGVSRTVVGSVPVADNIDIGIGLFSVRGTSNKERNFARSRPMRDVFGQDKRIAAVGFSLRF